MLLAPEIPRKPAKPKLYAVYRDFRGGWNADAAPDSLALNELALADNVDLDERGAASKRKGTAPLNAVSYGAQVERIIEWSKNDGTKIKMAVVGSDLCRIADDGTKTVVKALSAPDIGWFVFQDKFWFAGKEAGTDKFWTYDGATVAEVTPNSATDNDLTPVKRCRIFEWHPKSFRVFATGDPNDRAALYYSQPNDPTYFKNTSKLYPTTQDGPAHGLGMFGNALMPLYRNSAWAWKGSDPATDAVWERLPVGQGTVAPRTIRLTPNSLTFLGQGGLYSLSPGLLDYNVILVAGDELVKNQAKDKVTSVIRSIVHPETACALFDPYNERYLLAYGDDPANPRNNKILVLDWGLKAFTRYTGLQVNDFCLTANGDILAATNGYILKMGQAYRDWDPVTGSYKPIEMALKSRQHDLSLADASLVFHVKQLFRVFLAARQYGSETSSADITVTCDSKSVSFPGVSLDQSLTWGEPWGNTWGWEDFTTREARCRLKGKRVQTLFENRNIDEPVTLYGYAFEYQVLRARGVKV
ncbi:MAG: hypothetical protein AB1609_00770 [Bacillota bacterium]